MPHFYVNPKNINNKTVTIDKEQFHYLTNVRRFNIGDEINIFDGLGNCYNIKITKIEKNLLEGTILSSKTFQLSKTKINLYTAIPKGERFDWLIEKACEIGVFKIIPTIYQRSVITEFSENKIERFKKISISASSQSWRADIMDIAVPIKFNIAVDNVVKENNSLNILPYESEENNKLSSLEYKNIDNINIFIGPEGGFTKEEIDLALKNNFKIVTLGKNILRTETAGIVASAVIINSL